MRRFLLLSVGIAALLYLPGFFIFRSQALAIPSSPELIPLAQSLQVFTSASIPLLTQQLLGFLAIVTMVSGISVQITQIRRAPAGLLVLCGVATAVGFTLIARLARINIASRYLILVLPLVIISSRTGEPSARRPNSR